jgi:uncharacterized protein YjbI with pentapeptide repeats
MAMILGRRRVLSVAAAAGLAAGLVTLTGATVATAATCPTVDPVTHAVSPAPASTVDWSGCDLAGANLAGADLDHDGLTRTNLAGANLTGANLTSATIWYTNLAGADLAGAVFVSARFYRVASGQISGAPAAMPANWSMAGGYIIGPTADLTDADLAGTDLRSADLETALLSGANLTSADLTDADLAQVLGTANLTSAKLTGADLTTANLSGDTLTGATLTGASMASALLLDAASGHVIGVPASLPVNWRLTAGYLVGPWANLAGADLAGLDLPSADLNEANLAAADLTGADLDGADLSVSNLTGAQLAGANLDGIESGAVTGTPASLPPDWTLVGGYLLGPKVNLINADLPGDNLSGLDLAGAYTYYARFWNVNLDGADLAGATFNDGTDLTGATFTGANLSGVTWSDTTCPDGTNSDKYTDGCFSRPDTTLPVMTVTGVLAGHSYAVEDGLVRPGCQVTDPYSPVTVTPTLKVTGRSTHGLGIYTATCSGAQDRAGNSARPVSATYSVAYGFSGFKTPPPGKTLRRSSRSVTVTFGLIAASGSSIRQSVGFGFARAHHVRVTLRGPGISTVRANCGWRPANHGSFRCLLRVPRSVRTGRNRSYRLTAYENFGFGFVLAPAASAAVNPLVVHFR